jgi:putative ABC transport system substrate-binding protein
LQRAAQQGDGVRRVGALSTFAESDLEVQGWIRELVQRLQELGWTNGRNVQVDLRFSNADATRTSMLAAELIELRPDVVLRTARPVLTELRWFLIRPIRHGVHICARLRLPRQRSAYG